MSDISVETPEAAAARFLNSLFKSSHILVGLSGGGDSVGLMVALAEAIRAQGHGHLLSAATVDHGLRSESADEVRDVAALCARLGIPHQSRRWDGMKPQTGLMAAAREARYDLLAEMASAVNADLIVTGHTFDDQQETLSMRGARQVPDPLLPLRGIANATLFDRKIWILRPFLSCRRNDIREFLIGHDIGWIDDPSNDNMKFERVRVRTDLKRAGEKPLAANTEALMNLSSEAADWLAEHAGIHDSLVCEISRQGLLAKPDVLAYGISYLAAVFGGQPFGLASQAVGRILDFLRVGAVGRRTAGGVVFDLRRDALYIVRENRNIRPIILQPGGRGLWDGRFDVLNNGPCPVRIVAGAPHVAFKTAGVLPAGVIQRVKASAAAIESSTGQSISTGNVVFSPRFSPFDRFLTRFDYRFADQLTQAFGRMPYLSPLL